MFKTELFADTAPDSRSQNFWRRLTGSSAQFSLESRIFHSISVCLVILAGFYVPYNLFAGLYVASASALALAIVFSVQYYYSRFKGIKHSTLLFALVGFVLLTVNYFANSGIHGSTDLMWHAYLLLIFAISPYRQHLFWLIACMALFIALHITEYYYPQLVKHPFGLGLGQLVDRTTAFPLPILTIFIIIRYIKRSYDNEKNAVEARNQEILLQKELLEQSNTEKNKLMSIISHDMRAPLINIQGYLTLLNAQEINEEERVMLEKDLLLANNNTMQMLSNLLFWTRSQMENPVMHLREADLLSTLEATLDMEKMMAHNKDISLNYSIDSEITVIADTDMLQLVVRNLVSNAIKFTPKGGSINISAEQIDAECKITVSDTGVGIAPAVQDKIFKITTDPSFGTNNEKGVGLGLTLCKEYIERQGGHIGYESTFGRGSCFFVFVPMPATDHDAIAGQV